MTGSPVRPLRARCPVAVRAGARPGFRGGGSGGLDIRRLGGPGVRGLRVLPVGLLLVLALPCGASGQGLVPGAHAVYDSEGAAGGGAPGVGVRMRVDPTGGALGFLATAEWFFGDASDYWALGAHVVWQVSLLPAGLEPYLGAGAGHLSYDDEELLAERGNDTHLQLLAGTGIPSIGFASPFVEVRYELRGGELDSSFVLAAGIAF